MRDAAPALGRVTNLRLADGGNTLVADFTDVPKAVAALMPKAWPQRSVEALIDYEAPDGRRWPLVIEAVAYSVRNCPAWTASLTLPHCMAWPPLSGSPSHSKNLPPRVRGLDLSRPRGGAEHIESR